MGQPMARQRERRIEGVRVARQAKPCPVRAVPNVVILTGAGASVPLALPDTKGFIERMTGLKGDLEAFLKQVAASHDGGKPDIEWILERLDLYEDLGTLLETDRNLKAEVLRTVKDVVKRGRDAAERIRSAFPSREWVYPSLSSPAAISHPASAAYGSVNSLGSLTRDDLLGLTSQVSLSALGTAAAPTYETLVALNQSAPPDKGHWRDLKAPSYEPGIDPDEVTGGMLGGLGDQARRLRDTIYDNILRIYNSVDQDAVARLYRPLIGPLWGISQDLGTRLRVFTTNWDPSFVALKDATDLPIVSGMTSVSYEPHWSPSVYDKGGLDVYCLHGCCRWVKKRSGPGRILYNPLPLRKDSEYEVPVLYRPRTKGGAIAEEPYASAYAALDRAAMDWAVWVVIGYSFRDEPIQRVLERAAVRGTVKRLVVLSPAQSLPIPEELSRVTRHLRMRFGRPRAVRAVLEEVLPALGIPATPEANLRTRKATPRRKKAIPVRKRAK